VKLLGGTPRTGPARPRCDEKWRGRTGHVHDRPCAWPKPGPWRRLLSASS